MAVQSSGDPVPSVGEAGATGDIAELFAECRTTLGMSFVNLTGARAGAENIPAIYYTALKPLDDNGSLLAAIDAVMEGGMRRARVISGALSAPDPPAAARIRWKALSPTQGDG